VKAHPIVHIEIPASDLKETSQFYEEVFGWQIDHSMTEYPMFRAEGGPGGGFVHVGGDMSGAPVPYTVGKPLIFLDSDDIEASLAAVEANGGKTVLPKAEIQGVGWWAVFTDPAGNMLALFTDLGQGA
jgi:predicted enzyme related to lactoylglutathione lyase